MSLYLEVASLKLTTAATAAAHVAHSAAEKQTAEETRTGASCDRSASAHAATAVTIPTVTVTISVAVATAVPRSVSLLDVSTLRVHWLTVARLTITRLTITWLGIDLLRRAGVVRSSRRLVRVLGRVLLRATPLHARHEAGANQRGEEEAADAEPHPGFRLGLGGDAALARRGRGRHRAEVRAGAATRRALFGRVEPVVAEHARRVAERERARARVAAELALRRRDSRVAGRGVGGLRLRRQQQQRRGEREQQQQRVGASHRCLLLVLLGVVAPGNRTQVRKCWREAENVLLDGALLSAEEADGAD